jgi:hypothetical protein
MHELLKINEDMDTIIIFTNKQRIWDLQRFILSWTPDNNSPKKIIASDNKSFIIAWDTTTSFEDLSNLVDANANIFVLHHNSPDNANLGNLNNLLSAKSGEIKMVHKQHNDPEYKMIQEIDKYGVIEATKNLNELEKVFDELKRLLSGDPILEAKLELLHNCLLQSSAPLQKAFDDEFKILKVYEDRYKSFLTSINDKTDNDVFNADYIDAVKQLRIVLLGS